MLPVLIAGGGIGGLTLAVALARHGIASRVFEARSERPNEGAGIQLGPNATRVLRTLKLFDGILPQAVAPESIIVNDGVSGHELARLPLGDWIERRHGAPYWVVHRAALLETLWLAAMAEPLIELETGRTVQQVDDAAGGPDVTIGFADGGEASGQLLVGADGLWSSVRKVLNPSFALKCSGVSAARAVVPREQMQGRVSELATGVWLAPNAHVVHYPVNGGDKIAIVAIGKCDEQLNGWNTAISNDVVAQRFAIMPTEVSRLLAAAENWRQWPLYQAVENASWTKHRCLLIGDAAHPILPFLAQGGAMAIEDGFELAEGISVNSIDPADALATYCKKRYQRVANVQRASVANGRTYHLDGLMAVARNAALRTVPAELFMRRYDWIYGYRAG
jgi:2-polyprenyl-6-methoxyphenol hydroxylase-like FAD-dependent oxidoreductase